MFIIIWPNILHKPRVELGVSHINKTSCCRPLGYKSHVKVLNYCHYKQLVTAATVAATATVIVAAIVVAATAMPPSLPLLPLPSLQPSPFIVVCLPSHSLPCLFVGPTFPTRCHCRRHHCHHHHCRHCCPIIRGGRKRGEGVGVE